jgi:hypothetical protein
MAIIPSSIKLRLPPGTLPLDITLRTNLSLHSRLQRATRFRFPDFDILRKFPQSNTVIAGDPLRKSPDSPEAKY